MACCNRAPMIRVAVAFALVVASWTGAGCGALIGVDLGEPIDLDANPSPATLDEAGIGAPPDRSTSGVDDAAVTDAAVSDAITSSPAALPPSDAVAWAVSDATAASSPPASSTSAPPFLEASDTSASPSPEAGRQPAAPSEAGFEDASPGCSKPGPHGGGPGPDGPSNPGPGPPCKP